MKTVLSVVVISFFCFASRAQTASGDDIQNNLLKAGLSERKVSVEYKRDRWKERMIMVYINLTRMITLHLPLIDVGTPKKQKAAYQHSLAMAKGRYCDHTGFSFRAAKYNFRGENVACGYKSGFDFFRGWFSSKGHRANMLSWGYFFSGIGVCKKIKTVSYYDEDGELISQESEVDYYATQVFR